MSQESVKMIIVRDIKNNTLKYIKMWIVGANQFIALIYTSVEWL